MNYKIYSWEDKLTFGKYQDYTVYEVFETDPKYLRWANDNVEFFNLAFEVVERIDRALEEQNFED